LEAVRFILDLEDEVIIGVGSAQYSHTLDNPFTAGERIEIIHRTLKGSAISLERCLILSVPDVGEHTLWVSRVRSMCPPFETVYSNNPLVVILFREAGYAVKPVPLFEREKYWGTEIRRKLAEGGDWQSLVHPSVLEYMRRIRAEERLSALAQQGHSQG